MTRILCISDVARWDGFDEALEEQDPDIILMLGDLLRDGHFDDEPAFLELAAYKKRLSEAIRAHESGDPAAIGKLWTHHGGGQRWFSLRDDAWKNRTRKTKRFQAALKKTHDDRFWAFLQAAGNHCPTFVIKGNHDSLQDGYDPNRINAVRGVQEISGRVVEEGNLVIAGVEFPFRKPITVHKEFAKSIEQPIDILATHDPHNLVRKSAEIFTPRCIIKGHFGGGNYVVGDTPLIMTERYHHTRIALNGSSLEAGHYHWDRSHHRQGFTEADSDVTEPPLSVNFRHDVWPWMTHHEGPYSLPPPRLRPDKIPRKPQTRRTFTPISRVKL